MVRIVLNRDLHFLQSLLLDMAQAVVDMVRETIKAFQEKNQTLAEKIIKLDEQIDYYDRAINISVLEILALQQPVAKDLRRVISAFDISRNLERLADQAVNIAEGILHLSGEKNGLEKLCDLNLLPLAKEALFMLESSLNAFVKEDSRLAYQIIDHDELVDKMKEELRLKVEECINKYPDYQKNAIDYLLVIENLERVADLACNISENVIFVVEGRLLKGEEIKKETILSKEPLEENLTFQQIKKHAKLIINCLNTLQSALEAYIVKNKEKLLEIAQLVNEVEKDADNLKTKIRDHLPKGAILPVEKFMLFLYIKEQDALADLAEKLLKTLSLYHINIITTFSQELINLLKQSLSPLSHLENIIEDTFCYLSTWDELSREKAKALIREVRHSQYLTENLSYNIKEKLYQTPMEVMDFNHLTQIIDLITEISGKLENVVDLLRAMLAK
ncbi:MAG: phosphate signaling complex protein PhoU [Caldimicrobium sp.]